MKLTKEQIAKMKEDDGFCRIIDSKTGKVLAEYGEITKAGKEKWNTAERK